jgi:hypothetical protein
VVLADTGCRLKKADNAWQACSDTDAWPLATLAATAAGFNPDLVLHIGDYHYRENACPPDIAGCQGSPWGYGWDTWQADLFRPPRRCWPRRRGWWCAATTRNARAPARAGRFLDPRPYDATRSCDDPANDATGNYADPYAVSLGGGSQVIVFDSAKAGKARCRPPIRSSSPTRSSSRPWRRWLQSRA